MKHETQVHQLNILVACFIDAHRTLPSLFHALLPLRKKGKVSIKCFLSNNNLFPVFQ